MFLSNMFCLDILMSTAEFLKSCQGINPDISETTAISECPVAQEQILRQEFRLELRKGQASTEANCKHKFAILYIVNDIVYIWYCLIA